MPTASIPGQVSLRVVAVTALVLLGICGPACRRSRPKHDAAAAAGKGPAGSEPVERTRPPVDLVGLVQDARGAALPDALVIAWPKDRRATSAVQARSNPDGRFALTQLQPGTWTLLAEAAGFGTLEIDRTVPDDGSLVMALEGEGRSLGGIVIVAPNRAQPGARVVLGGPSLRWPREAVTDTHGVFALAGLGMGRFMVRATYGKLVSAAASLLIEEGTKQLPPVRLKLGLGAFVEGRVRDDLGRDLPGATVDVLTMPSDDLPATCRSDEDGRFAVGPVRPGRYQVLARLEGHVLLDAPEPLLGAGSRAVVALRLARGARVSGSVRDEDGAPLAGVSVSVVGLIGGHDEVLVLPGALPTAAEAAELPSGSVASQGSIRSALSNARGRFEVSGLAPGRSRLDVSPVDKLPLRREPLLLAPGDNRELGHLTVLTGVLLTGQVLSQDDKVLGEVQVEAHSLAKTGQRSIRVTADPQGQFSLRVPVGEYAITAHAKDHAPQAIPFLRAVGHPDPLLFHLAPRPAGAVGDAVSPTGGTPARRR